MQKKGLQKKPDHVLGKCFKTTNVYVIALAPQLEFKNDVCICCFTTDET